MLCVKLGLYLTSNYYISVNSSNTYVKSASLGLMLICNDINTYVKLTRFISWFFQFLRIVNIIYYIPTQIAVNDFLTYIKWKTSPTVARICHLPVK